MPYSDEYEKEVRLLEAWFIEQIAGLEPLSLTTAEYKIGTDAVPEPWKGIVAEAGKIWLAHRNYELSYNQICRAFFAAADKCGLALRFPAPGAKSSL
jgi:hypothetical protein